MFSYLLLGLTAALSLPVSTIAASGSGTTSRFWDCCKPSCAWLDKAGVNQPVRACDKFNIVIDDETIDNGCDTRSPDAAFTCTDNAPWNVNRDLSFGFAATAIAGGNESDWCCACYQQVSLFISQTGHVLAPSPSNHSSKIPNTRLVFTSGALVGKTMIVQSTNTGVDQGTNQFDLLIPGGGIGEFQNGCLRQFGQVFPGEPEGGVDGRPECGVLPTQRLRDGCYWRFDWFSGANNPPVNFTQVQCPNELTSRSGCKRSDDSEYPLYTLTPRPTTTNTITNMAKTTSTQITSTKTTSTRTTKATKISTATTKHKTTTASSAAAATFSAQANDSVILVPIWGKCGGDFGDGSTVCDKGTTCQEQNPYYSQCRPIGDSTPYEASPTTLQPTVVPSVLAQMYDRCGGLGWTGPTSCAPGSTCKVQDVHYSLCLPPDDDDTAYDDNGYQRGNR